MVLVLVLDLHVSCRLRLTEQSNWYVAGFMTQFKTTALLEETIPIAIWVLNRTASTC